jgi:hypothetical protein
VWQQTALRGKGKRKRTTTTTFFFYGFFFKKSKVEEESRPVPGAVFNWTSQTREMIYQFRWWFRVV